MPMTKPLVSVVIPCRNEARHIGGLLEALARQDFRDFEAILVDGQSTDGTVGEAERAGAACAMLRLAVVSNPRRTIPSALNLGIRHAKGDIVVRLDGHSRPLPDYLSQCLAALAESGAEAVGGVWEIQSGGPGVIARGIALAVGSPLGAGDALYRLGAVARPVEVDTVPFGCFRRRTWEALGGFDEGLLSNEDYEFNLRIRKGGGRVCLDPRIRCVYFARPSLPELARQYWRYGWWKAQVLKKHPRSLRLRQAIPLLWASGGLLLLLLGAFAPLVRPFALLAWGAYVATVTVAAGQLALRRRERWALWPALALAYAVIHFSWGLGACAGALMGKGGSQKDEG